MGDMPEIYAFLTEGSQPVAAGRDLIMVGQKIAIFTIQNHQLGT